MLFVNILQIKSKYTNKQYDFRFIYDISANKSRRHKVKNCFRIACNGNALE